MKLFIVFLIKLSSKLLVALRKLKALFLKKEVIDLKIINAVFIIY